MSKGLPIKHLRGISDLITKNKASYFGDNMTQLQEMHQHINPAYLSGKSNAENAGNKIFVADQRRLKYLENALENNFKGIWINQLDFNQLNNEQKKNNSFLILPDLNAFLKEYFENALVDHGIKVFGVTGTNGKSTCVEFLHSIFKRQGTSGAVGTIGYHWVGGEKEFQQDSKLTTPEIYDFLTNTFLAKEHFSDPVINVFIEVSSHALTQKRLSPLQLGGAIFLNLSQDHLDYHGSFENYYLAKKKLFTDYVSSGFNAVVNVCDEYGLRFFKDLKERLDGNVELFPFGVFEELSLSEDYEKGLFVNIEQRSLSQGQILKVVLKNKGHSEYFNISTNIIGSHNIQNLCACLALAYLNIPQLDFQDAVNNCKLPKGRLEKITFGGKYAFVDYAHTPKALENSLQELRKVMEDDSKLHLVFGCGGERDKQKRPIMGKVATENSDYVWVSDDNPRSEDPDSIIESIVKGIVKKNFVIERNRKLAIEKAIAAMNAGDVLLVAGKGHEEFQIFKNRSVPFSDSKLIREIAA